MKLKKKTIISTIALFALGAGAFYFFNPSTRGAGYSFFQTDWSGGISTTTVATHTDNQTGWTQYYSKDDVISTSTPTELSLGSTTASAIYTETTDFSAGTLSRSYASSSSVYLSKPNDLSCSSNSECQSGFCNSGICDSCDSFDYGGETYPVVIIGNQCWMAKNLNIGIATTSNNTGSPHSDVYDDGTIEKYCYNNIESNCDTYGGLYDWDEAMGYVTDEGAQGICPSGWHIPTDHEWYILEDYLKDDGASCNEALLNSYQCMNAGTKIKVNGSSGLNANLYGVRYDSGNFNTINQYGVYWTSYKNNASNARGLNIILSSQGIRGYNWPLHYGLSIRCIKN